MNICLDCAHCKRDPMLPPRCERKVKHAGIDPVDGRTLIKTPPLCTTERESMAPWHCGKRGRYFQQKETTP